MAMASVSGERLVLPKGSSFLCFRSLSVRSPHPLSFPFCPCSSSYPRDSSLIAHAKKRNSSLQPILKETTTKVEVEVEEEAGEELEGRVVYEEVEDIEDFDDDMLDDDNQGFEDDIDTDDSNLYFGDGAGGGGISLAGTWWDKKALTIAEEILMSFNGDLKIYAFKTSANSTIRLRIEKLSTKYGSPSMTDIEAFSSAYRARLNEAELAGTVPEDISLEVSSPGLERVVRIPEELERFKDRPMYVRYTVDSTTAASPQESEGVFSLVSYDLESCHCTWGIADVKINRKQAGKGRPLNKKQREWRLQTPFDSLLLVRLHSEC